MKDSTSSPNWDALLKHSSWVRALAQSLVSDSAAADDVEQQAWLQAAEKPPRHTRNLRSWMGSLVRSAAGSHWRRKKPTSTFVEELDSYGASEPIVERMDTVRSLADAVSSLPEPYATTIYLRYFEELSVREVAERQGVPVNTAQTRIARGLDKLRLRLEGTLGSEWRNQCLVFAAPLLATPSVAVGTTTAIAMTLKTKLMLTAAVVMLASLGVLQPWSSADTPDLASSSVDASLDGIVVDEVEEGTTPADIEIERSEFVSSPTGDSPTPVLGSSGQLVIRVVDGTTLEPVPHAEVLFFDHSTDPKSQYRSLDFRYLGSELRLEHFGQQLKADKKGEVFLPLPRDGFQVAARIDGKYAEVFRRAYADDEAHLLELTLLESVALSVRVLDANNKPAQGVHVGFCGTPAEFAGFPDVELVTNEQGRVIFRHLEKELQQRLAERGTTLAVCVPSEEPLFLEFAKDQIPTEEVVFHLPAVGRVEVLCRDTSGAIIPDGIPIGMQTAPREERFEQHLSQGYMTAFVKDGVAVFPHVGVGSNLVIHCSERYSNQEHTIEPEGPSFAGEILVVEMVMETPIPEFPILLVDKEGEPVPSKFYGVMQGVLTEDLSPKMTGRSHWVDDRGQLALKMSVAKQHDANRMQVVINHGFGRAVGVYDFALIQLDLDSFFAGSVQDPPVIPYGTDILVAGHCLSPSGRPIPNYDLSVNFHHKDGSPMEMGSSINQLRVSTDADGYFAFRGSYDKERFGVSLFSSSDLGAQIGGTGDIPFEVGQDDLKIVRSAWSNLKGRLLVDDPDFLKSVLIQQGDRVPTDLYLQRREAILEHPNGRFNIEKVPLAGLNLELRDKTSKELLASWMDVPISDVLENGDVQLPDWDLRHGLYSHSIEVSDVYGEPIKPSTVSFPIGDKVLDFLLINGGRFLSGRPQFDVTISAAGYRSKTVSSSGHIAVTLESGIPIHLSTPADVALPSDSDWFVKLGRIDSGKFHKSPVISPQSVLSLGQEFLFIVDIPGEWSVQFYRGIRMEDEKNGMPLYWYRQESYVFPDGDRWFAINVEDTTDRQSFVLPVTAEGFASMLE